MRVILFRRVVFLALLIGLGAAWWLELLDQSKLVRYGTLARANLGDPAAQYRLAQTLAGKAEAVKWLEASARAGSAGAAYALAEVYSNGLGTTKDYQKAVEWYLRAAEKGHLDAQYKFATTLCPVASLVDGHWKERGGPIDSTPTPICKESDSIHWLRVAADGGHALAQRTQGDVYLNGWATIPRDRKKAIELYEKSTAKGDSRAAFRLTLLLWCGGRDRETVRSHFDRFLVLLPKTYGASSDASLPAWMIPLDEYESDLDLIPDCSLPPDWKIEFLTREAEGGSRYSQLKLGRMYSEGKEVKKDEAEAAAWYRRAAENGNPDAQSYMGWACWYGEGVPKDLSDAIRWWHKAAEQGDDYSQNALGIAYSRGEGVPRDLVQAYKWWNVAAAKNRSARVSRDGIESQLTPTQLAEAQRLSRERQASDVAAKTEPQKLGVATAFYVSGKGHLLTNHHVVEKCSEVRLANSGKAVRVVSVDAANDLALLLDEARERETTAFATLRREPPTQGESVVTYGFPLQGALAQSGNVATGIISALSGVENNSNQIQVSAPSQPGSSGGPVLDMKGRLVGVVAMKLDAIKVARAIGTLPENITFAVNLATSRAFLEASTVPYRQAGWWSFPWRRKEGQLLAEDARRYTIAVECLGERRQ